jgi:hypothetical protein
MDVAGDVANAAFDTAITGIGGVSGYLSADLLGMGTAAGAITAGTFVLLGAGATYIIRYLCYRAFHEDQRLSAIASQDQAEFSSWMKT